MHETLRKNFLNKKNIFLGYTLKFEWTKQSFFESKKYFLIQTKLLVESTGFSIYQEILVETTKKFQEIFLITEPFMLIYNTRFFDFLNKTKTIF